MAIYETGDVHAQRRRVLLTGATGYIAGQLLPVFRERYDLRLIDFRDAAGSGNGKVLEHPQRQEGYRLRAL